MRRMGPTVIVAVSAVDDEAVTAIRRLAAQLNPTISVAGASELRGIISAPGTTLLFAKVDTTVVGMLTLLVAQTPTGIRAAIEDLVVDVNWRRQGIAAQLCQAAIEIASGKGAATLDLTSNSARVAAVRLYLRIGFERRDTNLFRYDLKK
jgi:ribosomal protein S18 acetylase RimI-like enzyme